MNSYTDVIIAGLGPNGATLANLLATLGLSVRVIDSADEVFPLPRATHFDGEVMRVFQSIGLAEQILPFTHVNPGMTFLNPDHEVILSWPRPGTVGPHGWHPSYRFHQPALETVLRKGLQRFEHVMLDTGCQLLTARSTDHGVEVELQRRGQDAAEAVRGAYLVGCDGGRSTVRGLMDVPMLDLGSHEQWVVIDVIMKRDVGGLTEGTVQYCDPRRPTTFMRCVGRRRRWEFMVMPGDDAAFLTTADGTWGLLSPWLTPDDADIERSVTYTFHSVIAHPWRSGRILLAGDAAHQMPPFLGQGMCAGVRDASNLAWKIAAVVRGRADDSLLDTYEVERSPHVRATIEHAMEIGEIIQTIDLDAARARDNRLGSGPREMKSIAPRLGAGLHRSEPLPAGMAFAQPLLASGVAFDDFVGLNFAVLGDAALLDAVAPATRERWRANQVVCLPDEGVQERAALPARAVIVRPDRYILGVADTPQELDRISGFLPTRLQEDTPMTATLETAAATPEAVAAPTPSTRPKRIGMLLSSSNPMAEPEIQRMLPQDVVVLTTRLKHCASTPQALLGMTDKIEEGCDLLADAGVDLIVFNCTAVSTYDPAMGAKIAGRIEAASGRPGTTTSDALLAAFEALGAKRIVLITPYIESVNLREIEFLAHHGYEVVRQVGLGLLEGKAMAAVTPSQWVELARENRDDSSDVYFLSCTAIDVGRVIEDIETELGRPVVTSNQAMLWHCLRLLGRSEPIPGLGALFRTGTAVATPG